MEHKPYIRDVSGGGTAVLFIHGFLGSPAHFHPFMPLVPDSYAVYNILLEGHGKTVRDFSRTSMNRWKKQVSGTVEALAKRYQTILIAAHSMGTFFAVDAGIRFEKQVKGLFLLAMPLKIGVKPIAVRNSIKSVFNCIAEDDAVGLAFKESCSVALCANPFAYIGWIPRYLELFGEARRARDVLPSVNVPCYVFQSKNDELVSRKSEQYIAANRRINLSLLEDSGHFLYSDADLKYLLAQFKLFINDVKI